MLANIIVIVIVAALFTGALSYIIVQKKKGTKCIGCPSAGSCTKYNCDSKQK